MLTATGQPRTGLTSRFLGKVSFWNAKTKKMPEKDLMNSTLCLVTRIPLKIALRLQWARPLIPLGKSFTGGKRFTQNIWKWVEVKCRVAPRVTRTAKGVWIGYCWVTIRMSISITRNGILRHNLPRPLTNLSKDRLLGNLVSQISIFQKC